MKTIKALIVFIIVAVGAAVAYAYSGWYDVSVGSGHNAVTEWYLETLRERSIETRAADIQVPALDDPAMVQAGSLHYDDGCAGCHGKPGREPADSFEPRPPALARHAEDPAEAYWIIQNGIKMSAMPIKGRGHSEEEIWSIVAFLQKQPELTPGEYDDMVEKARAEGEHTHSHEDGGHDQDGEAGSAESEDAKNGEHAHETPEDPGAVVDAFHHALAEGNGESALALLHQNATILEGGHLQTKAGYASGHLASDMEFLADATAETVSRDVTTGPNQATVRSHQRITGSADGQEEVHEVAETMSLVRTDAGWRITHISWSSADTAGSSDDGDTSSRNDEGER